MIKRGCDFLMREEIRKVCYLKISLEFISSILVLAQKKQIISDQGASDGSYGRSRKIGFVFQFLLRSVSLNRLKIPENARW